MEFLSDLHPLVVHFPIAFFSLYVLIELVNFFLANQNVTHFSLLVLFLGVIGGIFSVLTGNMEYQEIMNLKDLSSSHLYAIEQHEYYASITVWYFFAILVYQIYLFVKKSKKSFNKYLLLIVSLFGAYLIYKSASLGGVLVYEFGIGTELFQ